MKRLSLLFTISSIITGVIFFQSCDTLESDSLPENQDILDISGRTIYIQPSGEGVINLSNKINALNEVTLTVNTKPLRGNVEAMENGVFKYIASSSFVEGADKVVFSVFSDNQEVDRDTITVKVIEDNDSAPCHTGATADKFVIDDESFIGNTYKFDVLSNDKFCSQSYELSQIYDAKYGTSYFEDGYLYYTAASDAILEIPDLVVYELCQTIDGEEVCSSATVYLQHSQINCFFAIHDDSLNVAYKGIDTTYILPVVSNDTICVNDGNVDYDLKVLSVPEGMEAAFISDDKIKLFVPGNLAFPTVVGFHLPVKYQVCLAGQGCQTAVAKVFIGPKACKPVAVNDSLFLEYYHNAVGATNTFTLDVVANDMLCDEEFSLDLTSSLADGASVEFKENKILFTHDSDKWGEYTFKYVLCDANQNCSEAAVYLNIKAR